MHALPKQIDISRRKKGFTIVELVVSIAIFALMTALVVSRYGSFNQNTLLTNMAYDLALTVRTAQTYGLSVKSADATSNNFAAAYGVHFDLKSPTTFTLFIDENKNGFYDPASPGSPSGSDQSISTYTITQGASILNICLGSQYSDCLSTNPYVAQHVLNASAMSSDAIDITYRRPNPDAYFYCVSDTNSGAPCSIISSVGTNGPNNPVSDPVIFITLISSDKSTTQVIVIRKNGQISVQNQAL